ncbi:unnamed protein product [Rhizophagus irregularis]|uniref:Uncharacterized protein n=3 Tax=Rhizophagus irregularis TaxID=588596 RepID=A0A2I1F0B1_9GLOM|nr:hypothetical protein RhiirB3_443676 [Rhizophagus irregularis]CAB5379646.1 unnamed protein product [Rhizophagus irregularis]
MMNHNNPPLNNNINNIQDRFIIDNSGFNIYSSDLPQTNVMQIEQHSSNTLNNNLNISYGIPVSYATNNYERQSMTPSINNERVISTSTIQSNPAANSSNSSYTPYNSNHNVNTPSLNFNNPGTFRFEIPGFVIVVIPTTPTTNSTSLNTQNQFQQEHTYSNITNDNSHTQFQQQQQNFLDVNGSFINFNNFRG